MKRILTFGLAFLCAAGVSACAYIYPATGRLHDAATLQASPQYRDGEFRNEVASPPRPSGFGFILAVIRGRFEPRDRPAPSAPLPSVKTDLANLPLEQDILVWLGHSSYFVQVGGKRILVDPVFSSYAAPFPGIDRKSTRLNSSHWE